jgi:hypothetical protein
MRRRAPIHRKPGAILVAALDGHGVQDAVHGHIVANAGVPAWWPAWCLAYDVGAPDALAWILMRADSPRLIGKRAVWTSLDSTIVVERHVSVVDDGIVTSAGVAAGIDMPPAAVESLHGKAVADETAKDM